jgi:WD40 repeat protein
MAEGEPAGMGDEVQLMQGGVREWVQQTGRRSKAGLRTASPAVLLSLLCASAFCPLLMVGGVAGAGIAVLSSVGGGMLTQVVTDALNRLRQHGQARAPSRDDLEKGIAQQIQQILVEGDQRADALRSEIASVLKEIDAGGTALRAAMEETSERVRGEVIAAIDALGSGFIEMGFLLKDVAQAAAEIQKSLDLQGADVRAIIEQNERQSTDIRLVREDLAVLAARAVAGGTSVGARRDESSARWVRGCPYRGLLPFGESDAEVFYGRERLAAELAVKLAARVTRGGLVVVTGASGAGKSSLLRAGLVPLLAKGQQVEGSDQWPRIVMTPTKDPLTELAAHLAALGSGDTITVRDGLIQHPDQGHLAVWSAVLAVTARYGETPPVSAGKRARLVLIVDQFEQVFTLNPGPDGEALRKAFVMALCAAAANPVGARQEPPALVVIAVRGDFCDRCAAYPELKGALQDGQFVVGPMTESELRVAITGPADAAALEIDPALTDTILRDLHAVGGDDTSGVLPLLSQAMSLTWEKREGDRLTSHGYAQVGGVSHAVQTGADKVYDALPAGQQALARDVFRSMTVASRDGRLARRPVTRNDLYTGLPRAARPDIDAILNAFAAERLVVLDGDTAQLSHDVLLRAWPRLREWLEEDQASWILYGQLADAAAAWHDSHNDPSFLYRGTPLTAVRQAVTRWSENPGRYPALTGIQRDFMHASERAVARSTRRRRSAVAILALFALVASIAFVVASQARHTAVQALDTAVRQRDQAIYNQVVAEALRFGASDASLAAQLNLAAYRMQPARDSASRLWGTENTPLSVPLTSSVFVTSVAFSPDGHTLASGTYLGPVRLWSVADPAHPRPLGQPLTISRFTTANAVAFSPDGHTLAAGIDDGTIRLWDVASSAHPRPLSQALTIGGLYNSVTAVAFSPDGHTLASGNTDCEASNPPPCGKVVLWDVADSAHPRRLGEPLTIGSGNSSVTMVAFSPVGHTLASVTAYGVIVLWDVADPAHPRPLGQLPTSSSGKTVRAVAFSPDGHTLATGNGDGTVVLWDVADPAHPRPLGQPLTSSSGLSVDAVAFSPDRHMLASGNDDGTIVLWDLADPAHPRPLGQPLTSGSGSAVTAVAFSPDGHTLASGNYDDRVRLWSLPPTALINGSGAGVDAVAFSPNGHILATGNGDGTVGLWDVADPAHPRPLRQPLTTSSGNAVDAVAFIPHGHILATGNGDGTVGLWDVADPAHPRPLGQTTATGSTRIVNAMTFSPDGHILVTGNGDGTVELWNVTNLVHPQPIQAVTGDIRSGNGITVICVNAVAFSPKPVAFPAVDGGGIGYTLASGDQDGTVNVVNVTSVGDLLGGGRTAVSNSNSSSCEVDAVAFRPDGRTLATGNGGGTVTLWDAAHAGDPAEGYNPQPLGRPSTTSSGNGGDAVAFSPDGRTLASGNGDGTIDLWDVADPAHPQPLSQLLSTGSSGVYAVAFSPDGHTLVSGSNNGIIRLWDLNTQDAIERICDTAGGLTPQQWYEYIPQLQYQPSCVH